MAYRVLDSPKRMDGNRVHMDGNWWVLVNTHQTKAAAVREAKKRDRQGPQFKHYVAVQRELGTGPFVQKGEWMVLTIASSESPFKKKRKKR